jgi:integrase
MADPARTTSLVAACRTQRVLLPDGERTWTVLDGGHRVVEPVEQYLEYLRMLGRSPNTVKSYARALAHRGLLRSSAGQRASARARWLRLKSVCSLYRYHHFNGVEAASRLYERVFSGRHAYKPMLEHLARRRGHDRRVVRVVRAGPKTPPTLTPGQVGLILDACASWDPAAREWRGALRDRLLWALLAESGMRLGEALALQHRDWHTGLGDTPFVEVVPREDHPHGLRVKNGGHRRIYISDKLDRLYGEYLWQLCDAGADLVVGDLDSWWVFVNLARAPRFSPLRAETVAWQVRRLRRLLKGRVPEAFTPQLASAHARDRAAVVRGSPSMSSAAASVISTSRRRRTSTGGCPRTPSSAPSRSGSS